MVARINTGQSISKALNYNEKKVQQGEAECLHTQNFSKDAADLSFYDKLKTFDKQTTLNERTQTNTVHISLNFEPSEKLSNETLIAIANNYMEKIGFRSQPYVVYRHNDTGHPHIHIVTTNIKRDGSRISMHNMGRNQSELARKEIEKDFSLVKADSKRQAQMEKLIPSNAQKINPGKRSTKAAISNVLGVVIPQYKYGSLAELNAILKLYNIRADRCGANSQTFKHEGLLFRVLDENGKPTGTPIKASRFYMKPTLKNLEHRFIENEKLKQQHAQRLRTTIDYHLKQNQGRVDLEQLERILKKEGISVGIYRNKDNLIYGLTYVDHRTKSVFKGSELGQQYSSKRILERCEKQPLNESINARFKNKNYQSTRPFTPELKSPRPHVPHDEATRQPDLSVLDELLKSNAGIEGVPYPLKQSKRRRRKKRLRI